MRYHRNKPFKRRRSNIFLIVSSLVFIVIIMIMFGVDITITQRTGSNSKTVYVPVCEVCKSRANWWYQNHAGQDRANHVFVMNNYTTDAGNSHAEEFEAAGSALANLLTGGLAIIGWAIAVWAGLNIIQVLEKGKYEVLQEEVERYSRERYELNRKNFTDKLLELDDELNRHLYKEIMEYEFSDDADAALFFDCMKIEQEFQMVYINQREDVNTFPVEKYKDYIKKTKSLLKKVEKIDFEEKEFFIKYLKIRIAEFEFYEGYLVSEKDRIGCFREACNIFTEEFEGLGNPGELFQNPIKKDVHLTVYLINTIGECHSKILEAHITASSPILGKREEIEKACQYFETLYKILLENREDAPIQREVYYRNYGIFLERVDKYIKWVEKSHPSEIPKIAKGSSSACVK